LADDLADEPADAPAIVAAVETDDVAEDKANLSSMPART
jgi:hypothetical protein